MWVIFSHNLTADMSDAFSLEEVGTALKSLKNGKAPDNDNIHAEFLKHVKGSFRVSKPNDFLLIPLHLHSNVKYPVKIETCQRGTVFTILMQMIPPWGLKTIPVRQLKHHWRRI